MLEFAASGLLGSLFGGLFRLAPEVLKFFDKKNDRAHELKMFEMQTDLEKSRGEYRLEEKYVDYSNLQTTAIQSAFESQSRDANNSYRWVNALSALVRPIITYVLFGMYVGYKIIVLSYALDSNASWYDVATTHWTVEDFAMLNMILTFWFVGRTIEKRQK